MALSIIKSSVSPKASLSLVSDFRGSIRHVVNSSTEFASLASSSTSGLSWRAWYLRYPLTYNYTLNANRWFSFKFLPSIRADKPNFFKPSPVIGFLLNLCLFCCYVFTNHKSTFQMMPRDWLNVEGRSLLKIAYL